MLYWMLYALTITALLTAAALAGERVARLNRLPTRSIWISVLIASVALPFLLPDLIARRETVTTLEVAEIPAASEGKPLSPELIEPTESGFRLPSLPAWTHLAARVGWGTSSLVLTAILLSSGLTMRSRRRSWRPESFDDISLWVSPEFGPAVVGVRKPEIVLPSWLLKLDSATVRLALIHERQHLKAGDTRVLALGLLTVILMPWNPLLWWQLARLRLAVELDCDRRVLAGGVSLQSYGRLLLSMGERLHTVSPPAVALAECSSLLERRLSMMTRKPPRGRLTGTLAGAALVALLVGLACETPMPPEAVASSLEPFAAAQEVDPIQETIRAVALGDLLIIVDGVILAERGTAVYEELKELDIESIEVFRGAAAEILYGSRASAGAIVITTKPSSSDFETAVRLRAPVSMSAGDNSPLFVVDGVIVRPESFDIEMLNIESIEVFRGAAAEILYGSRASSGAIVITTKPSSSDSETSIVGKVNDMTAVRMRAPVSTSAGDSPLFVVDGVIVNTITKSSDLEALDIESVEVIKGAEALEKYGPRGSDGVVLIRTKAGGRTEVEAESQKARSSLF